MASNGRKDNLISFKRYTEKAQGALRAHFRPELLNRIDDVIFFHSLGRVPIRKIIEIQMRQVTDRLARRRIAIELSDTLLDLLTENGFDPAYGARPLKRTLQRLVLDPLATRILEGPLLDGGTVRVSAVGGEPLFEMRQPVTT